MRLQWVSCGISEVGHEEGVSMIRIVESGSDVSSHEETGTTSATEEDILSNTTTDEIHAKYAKSTQLEETNKAMNDQLATIEVQNYNEIYDNNGGKIDTKANLETTFTLVQKRMKGGRKGKEIKSLLSS